MALTPSEYQKIMHEGFPLSAAMNSRVAVFSEPEVVIEVPLEGNSNPHHTAFGGSINTALILAGWSRTFWYVQDIASSIDIVIASAEIKFLAPVAETIRAIAPAPDARALEGFFKGWKENQKGRLYLSCHVERADGVRAAEYQAKYVVLPQ